MSNSETTTQPGTNRGALEPTQQASGPGRSGPSGALLIGGLFVAVALAGSALGWALLSSFQSSGGRTDYNGLDRTLESHSLDDGTDVDLPSGVRPAGR